MTTRWIAAIFALSVASLGAQSSQPKPVPVGGNATDNAKRDEAQAKELRSIAEQLAAIKDQQAKDAKDRAEAKPQKGPPIWSNWALATIAGFGAWAAWNAFKGEREAVRLTERADVLFYTMRFFDTATLAYSKLIVPTTTLVIVHRNFGRTRAKDLRIRWRMYIEGDPIPEIPFLLPIVLGAGAKLETRVGPTIGDVTGARYNQVGAGGATLKLLGEVEYVDVFGKGHRATFRGMFRPPEGSFAVETETDN